MKTNEANFINGEMTATPFVAYMQIVEQTDEEKLTMYMKCTKKQLAEMLIQCNKLLDMQSPGYGVPKETFPQGNITWHFDTYTAERFWPDN